MRHQLRDKQTRTLDTAPSRLLSIHFTSAPSPSERLHSLVNAVDDLSGAEEAAVAAVALVGDRTAAGGALHHVPKLDDVAFPARVGDQHPAQLAGRGARADGAQRATRPGVKVAHRAQQRLVLGRGERVDRRGRAARLRRRGRGGREGDVGRVGRGGVPGDGGRGREERGGSGREQLRRVGAGGRAEGGGLWRWKVQTRGYACGYRGGEGVSN